MTTTTTDPRLEPVDNTFDDATVGDAPSDEELEEMYAAWEEEEELALADASDWRGEISRDYERTEGRAIQRSLERYR